jgi:hypothetical protein
MKTFNVRVEDADGHYVAIKVVEAESKDDALEAVQADLDANVADSGYVAAGTTTKRGR